MASRAARRVAAGLGAKRLALNLSAESLVRTVGNHGVRRLGTAGVLAQIPTGLNYYLTIDIDGFDPSIAPGTGTPSHGGFLYYEVLEIIQALAVRSGGNIIGMDLVEVSPPYDPTGVTSILAAQLLLNSIGFIFHARKVGPQP